MNLRAFYGPLAFSVSLVLWAYVSSLVLIFGALMAPVTLAAAPWRRPPGKVRHKMALRHPTKEPRAMSATSRTGHATPPSRPARREEFRRKYDEALGDASGLVRGALPAPASTASSRGAPRSSWTGARSTPGSLLGHFPVGTAEDVDRAVHGRAAAPFPTGAAGPGGSATAILRKAADLIEERGFELSALVSLEAGKNRLEAMGDVTETADLIRYYCEQMERNDGFDRPMARFSPERGDAIGAAALRRVGDHQPLQLPGRAGGRADGRRPGRREHGRAEAEPRDAADGAARSTTIFREAGVPPGVVATSSTAPGDVTGEALADAPGGGRHAVHRLEGRRACRSSTASARSTRSPASPRWAGRTRRSSCPRPTWTRPPKGVMRSAFGLQGQKCSACSRVYVHESVAGRFTDAAGREDGRRSRIGDPRAARHLPRPGHPRARVRRTTRALRGDARRSDGKVLAGAQPLRGGALAHGYFVAPTIVDGLPKDHQPLPRGDVRADRLPRRRSRRSTRRSTLANRTEYGLTAGFFSAGPGGGRGLPRPHRGRRRLREPPRRRHHGRLAGRAALRRLEGRAAPRARPPAASTTCSSSCASRAGPSSTEHRSRTRSDP